MKDIENLYQTYGPMVLRRCRQLLRDEDLAQDALQDVFVRVLHHPNYARAQYPSSLLYRMATNICLNQIRDGQRQPDLPGDDVLMRIAGMEDPEPKFEARSMLGALFGRHQESTRTMAVLYYVDGFTLEEVAHEVGMSVSGVRKRLRGLRESLFNLEDA